MSTLAHTILAPPGREPRRWMLFLHGILGSRANWRGFARKTIARRDDWGAVLVDLRMHGDSQGFAPPHTVDACARDLVALCDALDRPIDAVLGHSFGGKVALTFSRGRKGLAETWMIDSMPGPRPNEPEPGSPMRIIDLLRQLPREYDSRDGFVATLSGAGIDGGVARWLAMNLVAQGEGYHLRLELDAIRSLLDDYLVRDDWDALEDPARRTHLHLVVAGRSSVWSPIDLQRAERHEKRGWLTVHRIPDVGHWVHVEDPDGLLAVVAPES